MLFVESKKADYGIEGAARTILLEKLQDRGMVPLVRSARLHCFELALMGPERVREMDRLVAAWAETEGDTSYVRGDVFCSEDFALFLIFEEDNINGEPDGSLRAGIVYTEDTADPQGKLDAFCRNVQDALEATRGGGNGAGFAAEGSEWQTVERRVPEGFVRFAAAREEDATAAAAAHSSGKAATGAEHLRVVGLLEDVEARRFLNRLIEAQAEGQLRDLLTSGASSAGEGTSEPLIARLVEAGLVRREILVSCRKQGRPLFRLPSPDALAMVTASNAMCNECGASVADERAEELLTPTDVAAKGLKDGSWMASRLRAVLLELGVPNDDVATRLASADGEVQLMANVCGEPFLFILRDGDVSAAHARRALDVEAETKASHLVLVASGRIQEEARVRLREHARRRARAGSDLEVMLVEGMEAANSELRHAFERVSQRALAEELVELDASLGLNVGYLIATRFRLMQKSGALKDLAAASAAGSMTGSLREI